MVKTYENKSKRKAFNTDHPPGADSIGGIPVRPGNKTVGGTASTGFGKDGVVPSSSKNQWPYGLATSNMLSRL